jgi:hypothetical protein
MMPRFQRPTADQPRCDGARLLAITVHQVVPCLPHSQIAHLRPRGRQRTTRPASRECCSLSGLAFATASSATNGALTGGALSAGILSSGASGEQSPARYLRRDERDQGSLGNRP